MMSCTRLKLVQVFITSIVLSFTSISLFAFNAKTDEKKMVVFVPSYNNAQWYKENLDSIFSQNYENYSVFYVDDCSPDGTGDLVEQYVKELGQEHRFILVKNKERILAMANIYKMVHMADDDAIMVNLDGDDWFEEGDNALSLINEQYKDPNVWATYGNYRECTEDIPIWFTKPVPRDVIDTHGGLRDFRGHTAQPRTFYAWLFKQVKLQDLLYEGVFLPMTYDIGMMVPIFEMAGDRFQCILDVIYVHNLDTLLNDHKVDPKLQVQVEMAIRNGEPYERLDESLVNVHDSLKDAQADMVIYSCDRPLQLYALLESVEGHMQGLDHICVIYKTSDDFYAEAYQEVSTRFPSVQFVKQGENYRKDFKPLTMEAVFDSPADYIIFASDDIVVKDEVDLNRCIVAMEQTHAHAFYLRLGKNLSWCYSMDCEQKVPTSVHIKDDIYAWQFLQGECDWHYPDNIDMTLFRKKDIRSSMENREFSSPNTFEGWGIWQDDFDWNMVGLFYEHSKIVNIPLNVVQVEAHGNPHMDVYSPKELLKMFNTGLKMDSSPLFCINNISAHMEYTPTFVHRYK